VYDNQGCTEVTRAPGQLWDLGWWYMGKLHARDQGNGKPVGILAGESRQLGNQAVQVGAIGVIGDGQHTVANHLHSTQHLAGKQDTIAEE
jgi:hypothetical protein